MELAVSIVGYVLAAAFIVAGGAKLARVKMMRDNFARYGFPDWFLRVVGAGEVVGGILLLFPAFAIFGATGLAVIMVGAVITHIMCKEAPMAVPALVLLGASVFTLVGRAQDFAQMVSA
jgi:putative oxidoreductase